MTYSFRCNGTTVYVRLRPANLLQLADSGSEQCEGCGSDIVESGIATLWGASRIRGEVVGTVRCDCGATYNLFRAHGR